MAAPANSVWIGYFGGGAPVAWDGTTLTLNGVLSISPTAVTSAVPGQFTALGVGVTPPSAGVIQAQNSIKAGTDVEASAGGFLYLLNRLYLASGASGLANVLNGTAAAGVQLNVGTAEPTFNNGTVTTGSRNVAGQVTLTGGNTAGTVTFGAPNWTNTPFVVITEGQGTNTAIVTATSVSAFSFTGATANGIVRWVAIGRV